MQCTHIHVLEWISPSVTVIYYKFSNIQKRANIRKKRKKKKIPRNHEINNSLTNCVHNLNLFLNGCVRSTAQNTSGLVNVRKWNVHSSHEENDSIKILNSRLKLLKNQIEEKWKSFFRFRFYDGIFMSRKIFIFAELKNFKIM